MTRNLKALGLALLAALAVCAVVASAASADKFESESANGKTVLTGEDTGASEKTIFGTKSSGIEVKCEIAKYSGTVAVAETTTINVVPTYQTCEGPTGSATIDTTECEYIIHSGTTSHSNTTGGTTTDAPVDLKCATGKNIVVTDGLCPITIGTQSGLHGVVFTNLTENGHGVVEVNATVDNIHFTTPGNFFCSIAGLPSTGTNGTLTGKVLSTGYEDTGSAGGTYDTSFTEGGQVNIKVAST